MKKYLLFIFMSFSFITAFAQKNISPRRDSVFEANSEQWELKRGRKLFGDLKKLDFGPYSLLSIEKLDSPLIKRKIKGGPEFQLMLGHDAEERNDKGVFFDVTKKVRIEKTKYYRELLSNNTDTTEILYSILSTSIEERRTVMGTILNGSKENGPTVIGSAVDIQGYIITNVDSVPWKFSYQSSSENKNSAEPNSFGYLKSQTDSLYLKPIIEISVYEFRLFKKTTVDTMYYTTGLSLINQKGEQVAEYQYPKRMPTSGKDNKSFIWMRKDLNSSYQQAISSYWASTVGL